MAVELPPGLLPSANLSDLTNVATARTNLGLGTVAQNNTGTGFVVSGGSISVAYGTASGTAAQGNLAEFVANKNQPSGYAGLDSSGHIPTDILPASLVGGALLASNNLSDLTNATVARANLSLGSISLQSAASVTITGGTMDNVTVGATIPDVGHFTTLTATAPLTNDNSNNVPTTSWIRTFLGSTYNPASVGITGGTIDGVTIGGSTAGIGHFTTLTASTVGGSDNSGNVATTAWVTSYVSGTGGYNATNVSITGGTINGTTIGATSPAAGHFSTLSGTTLTLSSVATNNTFFAGASSGSASAPTFRAIAIADLPVATNSTLGLVIPSTGLGVSSGTITVSYGTSSGTAAQGNDARILGALQVANNLSDAGLNASTARANLGLGNIAVQNTSSVTISGGTLNGVAIGGVTAGAGSFTTLTSTGLTNLGSSGSSGNSIALLGARADQSAVTTTPTTGFSATIPNNCSFYQLNPGGTLATGTLTMPSAPINGQILIIQSSQQVTALTLSPNSGQTVTGAPASILAGSSVQLIYLTSASTWYGCGPNPASVGAIGGTINGVTIGATSAAAATFTTITLTGSQSANLFLASPSGSSGAASFRVIAAADLPLATVSAVGGIIVGTGLGVSSGTVSVTYGTGSGTATQGNDSRVVNALQSGNNLSDVGTASTARTNLGLGTIATQAANSIAVTGGTLNNVIIGGSTPAVATFTTTTVGSNSASTANIYQNTAAGNSRLITVQSVGTNRWAYGADSGSENFESLSTSAQTTSGTTLTFTSTTGISNGMKVLGTNIATGTTVSSFTGTTVVLSIAVTGTVNNGATIEFETNTGSSFVIVGYDDYGNSLGDYLSINRSTGSWTLGNAGGITGSVTTPMKIVFPIDYGASGSGLKIDLLSGTYGLGVTSGNLNVVSGGTTTFSSGSVIIPTTAISGGTLDSVTIGGTTPGAGHFSTLTSSATLSPSDNSTNVPTTAWVSSLVSTGGTYTPTNVTITGGSINGVTIGGSSASPGTFTTLTGSTLTLTGTQTANTVFAGPSSGSAAAPTWRTLVAADLPIATVSVLGAVSISTGLNVTSGAVSVNFGTTSGTVAQGNDSRLASALQASNNLSDVANAATARTNLSLGTISTQSAASVAITGGTINSTPIGATTPSTGSFSGITLAGAVSGTVASSSLITTDQINGFVYTSPSLASLTAAPITIATTTTATATNTLTFSSTTGVIVGMLAIGSGAIIPYGTTVTAVSSPNVTLSATVTVASGQSILFQFASQQAAFGVANSNVSKLIIYEYRNASGSDWHTASKRQQLLIDNTLMGFVEYNPPSYNNGIALGTSSDGRTSNYGLYVNSSGGLVVPSLVTLVGGNIDNSIIGATTPAAATFTTASFGSGTGSKINLSGTTYGIGNLSTEVTVFHPNGSSFKVRNGGSTGGTAYFTISDTGGLVFTGSGSSSFSSGINSTTIGATTASTGSFTTLNASSTAILNTFSSSGVTITGGSINGTTVGASTASTGAFTTLTANTPTAGNNSTNVATTAFVATSFALLASPTFTGTPAAPTASPGTNTTQIATTAFVTAAVAAGDVTSVVGSSGAVTLTNLVSGGVAPLASPTLTGTPLAPTATGGTNTTQIATTAYVVTALGSYLTTSTASSTYAPLASPTFTGTPAVPTASIGTETTQIASTAFVYNQINSYLALSVAGSSDITLTTSQASNTIFQFTGTLTGNININFPAISKVFTVYNFTAGAFTITVKTSTGTGVVVTQGKLQKLYCDGSNINIALTDFPSITLTGTSIATTPTAGNNSTQIATTAFVATSFAPLASPALTGTPTAPTATGGTNTTQIATTAFVVASFAPLASPALTGTPTVPTASTATNTTQAASTAYVQANLANYLTTSSASSTYAPLASPTFTGSVVIPGGTINNNIIGGTTPAAGTFTTLTANTPTVGTNTTVVATTAYVMAALGGAVTVSTTGGSTTLSATQYGCSVILVTGTLTSNATLVTPNAGSWMVSNRTTGAFTVTVKTSGGTGSVIDQGYNSSVIADGTNVVFSDTDFNSVALIGTPTAPTATGGTNTTQIATTAFVTTALGSYLTTSSASSTYAPISSPSLTGTPLSPTASPGTNTTQIATTAYVIAAVGAAGSYNAASVAITGGTINSTVIGGTTAAAGTFTTLTATTSGLFNGTATVSAQGHWLGWNRTSAGETNLMNQKGSGTGGILFSESTTGNSHTNTFFVDATGNGTFYGSTLTLGTNSGTTLTANLNSATGNTRYLSYQTAGVARWAEGATSDSETTKVTLNTSASTGSGTTLTFTATTGVSAGMFVYGTNISNPTTVVSTTSTTVVLSAAVTNTGVSSGAAIQFAANTGSRYLIQSYSDFGVANGPSLTADRAGGYFFINNQTGLGSGLIRGGVNDGTHTIVLRGDVTGVTPGALTNGDTGAWLNFGGVWRFRQMTGSINTIWLEINTSNLVYNGNNVYHTGNLTIANYATLASPTFTGTPAAPTASANTNTTQIATTAFVVGQVGTATPLINGTAAVGTSLLYSRQDHVHPTDTTRAPLASPTFTGTVTIPSGASISGFALLASPILTGTPLAPTATAGTNTTQIATTAFVVTSFAPLASPTLTGTPAAPTASVGTSTTQIATTAFVETAIGGASAITCTGGSTTLSATQYGNGILTVTGTLTSAGTLVVPTTGQWIVYNGCTGAFTLTIKTVSGTGVIVSQGVRTQVYSDGTNVQFGTNSNATWLLEWEGGAIVANGTYHFSIYCPYAGTINSMDYFTGAGSFTADVEIGGTAVTSLSAVSVSSSTQSNTAATGANTFAVGSIISVVISSATSSPTNACLSLRITKS